MGEEPQRKGLEGTVLPPLLQGGKDPGKLPLSLGSILLPFLFTPGAGDERIRTDQCNIDHTKIEAGTRGTDYPTAHL